MIIGIFFGTPNDEGGFSFKGLPTLGMFLIGFFLWPISEGIWGQPIGKRFTNLIVVTNEFKPIGMRQALGRFFSYLSTISF